MPASRLADRRAVPGVRVAGIQRSRLLSAAVGVIDERGYLATTVGDVTARARVSRRTFYELFGSMEECLAAVLEETLARVEGELAAAGLEGLPWRERIRGGLWAVLSFLDREPVLARVCVVQAAHGGPGVSARREEVLARLAAVVDAGRLEGTRGADCGPLTAEGLVGAALSIVHARLARRKREPLAGLVGELVGMIVLPYLGSAAARREQARPLPGPLPAPPRAGGARRADDDPLVEVPMRLTYRTTLVLEGIAELSAQGSHPSNRQVADRAGIPDAGQVSKLLARLERLGLLANTGNGARVKGEPNAWALTAKGERVTQSIRAHTSGRREAA